MIAIVDYGVGNLTSVKKALDHLGANCVVTSEAVVVRHAKKIILPGVGHFSSTRALDELGLRAAIVDAIAATRPFLGICVGMQWMYSGSSESPDVRGLGLFEGECSRFASSVKSPHVGWNTLLKRGNSQLLRGVAEDAFAYFTHSYRAPVNSGCVASTDHAGEFAAVIERENLFGMQFHPEKSAGVGLAILKNFLELPC